jgi:hypothetical protein
MLAATLLLLSQLPDPQAVSADPDTAVTEAAWRGSLRAKIAFDADLLAIGKEPRFRLRLPAFIELLNAPGDFSEVPYDFWRARVQIEGLEQFTLTPELRLGVAQRLEHESDHPTGPSVSGVSAQGGWVNMNALATIFTLRWRRGPDALNVAVTARLHLLTCTRDTDVCGLGGGAAGSLGFEGSLGASYQRVLVERAHSALDVFGAAFASYLPPTDLITLERRVTLKAGAGVTQGAMGRLFIFLEGWFGTQGGYLRNTGDVVVFGGGIGWSSGVTAD